MQLRVPVRSVTGQFSFVDRALLVNLPGRASMSFKVEVRGNAMSLDSDQGFRTRLARFGF
jgi:hypothetical protein